MRAVMKILIAVALVTIGCKGSGKPKPGPAVAWRATIDKDTFDGIAVANGSLITVDKSGVHAIRAGDGAAGASVPMTGGAAPPRGAAGDGAAGASVPMTGGAAPPRGAAGDGAWTRTLATEP